MKNRISLIVCVLIGIILIQYRLSYSDVQSGKPLKITTWDAFGYYMYLPSKVIYDDMTELNWLNEIDSTYELTGGSLYQSNKHDNGNYVNKYLGGVSIMQAPFFFMGHAIAKASNYKADGFSPPYQWSIAFGALFYTILALFILRSILLRYYSDHAVSLSILLMVLATNLIQYVSIDSAQSHVFIFPMYVFVIYATIKWHESPSVKWAALIGFIIGLATISRPTELIMFFIPLLWETHTKDAKKRKWGLVKQYKSHVIIALLFGVVGIAPQLIYWKLTSGSFIYNVGSKWFFFNPWWRVLFGFTKGWFIYTPVTLLFVAGFFFMKKYPFRKSVIVFCLLNIWIVIAWSDWQYGATYSTRALVQSYPVFALAFTAIIERIISGRGKYAFYVVGVYLIFVNIVQVGQYNETILHYRDMNARYYAAIYLDPSPTPLDMSLLDTDEILWNESGYERLQLAKNSKQLFLYSSNGKGNTAFLGTKNELSKGWIKVTGKLKVRKGFSSSWLVLNIKSKGFEKTTKVRIPSPISHEEKFNRYAFFMELPKDLKRTEFRCKFECPSDFEVIVKQLEIEHLSK